MGVKLAKFFSEIVEKRRAGSSIPRTNFSRRELSRDVVVNFLPTGYRFSIQDVF